MEKYRLHLALACASAGTILGLMALLSFMRFDDFLVRLAMWWVA